jgi:hypothetical protein
MNFIHSINQRTTFGAGQDLSKVKTPSLLTKIALKYQQLRLLDNKEGFNVPVLNDFLLKRKIQGAIYDLIKQREDLNVQSKFVGIMGGYQSLNEHSFLLLVDISKDRGKTQDEMKIDGGNIDDDKIEREWFQVTVLTTL